MPHLIAIIDDDPDTVAFLAVALEDTGYQTIVSTNHDTVLELVQRVRPDLFIINLMRGWAYVGAVTLAVLREHPATATVPVILCSANTRFLQTQRQALAQRRCLILAKPFLYQDLLAVVAEAISLA